jgi:hypothetical protein
VNADLKTNSDFVEYDADGRIFVHGNTHDTSLSDLLATGANVIIGYGTATDHYVDLATRTICERQACPASMLGTNLVNLPVPCTIVIDGKPYACADDIAELSFNHVGTYSIEVHSIPYLTGYYTVTQS